MHALAQRDGVPIVFGRTLLIQPAQCHNKQHGGNEDSEQWQDAPATLRAIFAAAVVVVFGLVLSANLA
eukprot:6717125-Prymnesium_polylepis.1